jgi:hypothetical protein
LNIDTTLNNLTINFSIQETKDDRVESLILKQIRPEAEDDSMMEACSWHNASLVKSCCRCRTAWIHSPWQLDLKD